MAAITLAELNVLLTASTKGFDKELNRATKKLDDFAATARRVAAKATAALAGIATAGGYLVKVASDAEELDNVIRQSFGSMADEVDKWARETGRAVGRSTYQMRQFAGQMQAMIRPMVGSNEQAAEMSKTLAQLAVDMGSFWNVADKEAFDALRAGIVGETEPLRRFGIVLTEAALQAYAMEKGIRKSVSTMSEAEKVTLRYQYILDRTTAVHGDAARTIDSFANQWKALQADVHNLAEEYGQYLLPAAKEIIKQVRGLLHWFGDLDDATKKQIVKWGALATAILGLVAVFGVVATAISVFVKGLMLLGGIVTVLTTPWVLALGLLALAASLLYEAWDQDWGGLRTTITSWADAVGQKFEQLKNWWETSNFGKTVRQAWAELVKVWQSEELTLPQKVIKSVSIIANAIADLIPAIRQIWDTWKDDDLSLGQKVLKTVSIIASSVAGLIESIMAWWTGVALELVERGAKILGLNPDDLWIVQFLRDLNAIWISEDLTFGQKVVETIKLLPGGRALVDFFSKIKAIWTDEDLTLPQKVIKTVSLVVKSVAKLIESIMAWWTGVALELVERGARILGLNPDDLWIVQFLKDLNAIWTSEDLTFGQKVVESIRLIPGGQALIDFFARIKAIWTDEDLTLPEKVLKTVTLIATSIAGLIESIMRWWTGVALELVERGARILGLEPDSLWVVQFLKDLNAIWASEDLTFSQKVVESIKLIPGGQSLIEFFAEIKNIWTDEDLTLPQKVIQTVTLVAEKVAGLIESIMTWWTGAAINLVERGAKILGLDPDRLWITDFLKDLNAIWADEELTFGEKVVESIKLLPGGRALVDFFGKIKSIWTSEELTLPQKVLETVELVASSVAGLIESIMSWWTGISLELVRRGAKLLGLDPDKLWITEFLEDLNKIWQDTELTFEEKVVKSLRLIPPVNWAIDFMNRLKAQLFGTGGIESEIERAMGIPGVGDLLRAIYKAEGGAKASIAYGVTGFRDQGYRFGRAANQQFFEGLVEAIGAKPGTRAYFAAASATTVNWYWQQFKKQYGLAQDIAMSDLSEDMRRAWVEYLGARYAPVAAHELNKYWVPNVLSEFERQLRAPDVGVLEIPIRVTLDFADEKWQALRDAFQSGDWSEIIGITSDIWSTGVLIGVGLSLVKNAGVAILAAIGSVFGNSAGTLGVGGLPLAIGVLTVGIQLAEAMAKGSFKEFGANLVAALAAGIGIGAFTGSPATGMLAFTIVVNLQPGKLLGNFHEWLVKSIAESVGDKELFGVPIVNLLFTPETRKQYGIGTYQSGTPWTGWGPLDEVAGVVHRQEAVIPAKVLRRGPAAVLEFLGAPGFQAGRVPAGISMPGLTEAQATVANMQDMFRNLGQMILAGFARLSEIIFSAIEKLAIAILGEEKVAEIKETFATLRTKIEDFINSLFSAKKETDEMANAQKKVNDELSKQPTLWQRLATAAQELANSLKERVLQSMPVLSDAINVFRDTLQKTGDPLIALGSALVAVITHSKTFQTIMTILNNVGQAAADMLGMLLEPLLPLVQVLSMALLPVFKVIGQILSTLFAPVLRLLFPIIKYVGVALTWLAEMVQRVRAWFLRAIGDLVLGIGKLLRKVWRIVGMDLVRSVENAGQALKNSANAALESAEELKRSREELLSLTYEEAMAKAKLAEKTNEVTEALRNVPTGFKIAFWRYQIAEPVKMAEGGIVTRPTLAEIGEKGPEAVLPLDQADIGGVTVHITVEGNVYADDLERRVERAVSRAVRRNRLSQFGTVGARA